MKDRVDVNEVLPMSSRSINDLYLNNHSVRLESPSTSRRTNSRNFHSGTVGNTRDEVNCTQKIKPDALCYSPAHYGKTNGLNHDFGRLSVGSQDRSASVTHVSTSYIPVRSLSNEQMLHTSTVLPNSRSSRNSDIRRCSVYDNMPPGSGRDPQMYSSAPQRTALPSSYPNNRPYSSSEAIFKRGNGESGNRGNGESGNRGNGESGNRGNGESGNRGNGESGNRRNGESGMLCGSHNWEIANFNSK